MQDSMTADLFGAPRNSSWAVEPLAEGAAVLRGFASAEAPALMDSLRQILTTAPFRHMVTPGGLRMSVAWGSILCSSWWVRADDGQENRRVPRLSGSCIWG